MIAGFGAAVRTSTRESDCGRGKKIKLDLGTPPDFTALPGKASGLNSVSNSILSVCLFTDHAISLSTDVESLLATVESNGKPLSW